MTLETTIAELKVQYPTIRVGSDEEGYTDLSSVEYDATISQWANAQIAAAIAEIPPTPAEKIVDGLDMTVADLKKLLGLPA